MKFNTTFAFDLKHQPFETDSQIIVVTGGPLSGKTSLLEVLGVPYEREVARAYLEQSLAAGKTKHQLRGDEAAFQQALVEMKLAIERACPKNQVRLFDRAMPDSITYARACGLDPTPVLAVCKRVRYAVVFLFDLLPAEDVGAVLAADPVRTEDSETRRLLDEYLEKDYASLGYEVQRVPVMSIAHRKAFVLDLLGQRGMAL